MRADATGDGVPETIFVQPKTHVSHGENADDFDAYYIDEFGNHCDIPKFSDAAAPSSKPYVRRIDENRFELRNIDASTVSNSGDGKLDAVHFEYFPKSEQLETRINVKLSSPDGAKLWTEYERTNDLYPAVAPDVIPPANRDYHEGSIPKNRHDRDCVPSWYIRDTGRYRLDPLWGTSPTCKDTRPEHSDAKRHCSGPHSIDVILSNKMNPPE